MDSNHNDLELNNFMCEATGCFEKATDEIVVKVGNLGAISRLLCSDCVPKFPEVDRA
jgi:hypothetical protein